MAKALLINPSYFRTYGSNEGGIAFPVYPILSLAALAGAIKQRGHEVRIMDLSYRRYDPELIRDAIRKERPDVVGITATTPLANQMRDISFLVKDVSAGILTIAGGAHPSALPYETMRESALDMLAFGEADFVVADLLDGKALVDIPGLYRRQDGRITANPPAGLLRNLDDLPMPAWEEYPYTIEYTYSDNGKEYKGTDAHEFVRLCRENGIGQKFTRCNRPQTNGKAERVIRTLMEMWHTQEQFRGRKQRQISLLRFINFYNTVKPHKGIDGITPYEKLFEHFYGQQKL